MPCRFSFVQSFGLSTPRHGGKGKKMLRYGLSSSNTVCQFIPQRDKPLHLLGGALCFVHLLFFNPNRWCGWLLSPSRRWWTCQNTRFKSMLFDFMTLQGKPNRVMPGRTWQPAQRLVGLGFVVGLRFFTPFRSSGTYLAKLIMELSSRSSCYPESLKEPYEFVSRKCLIPTFTTDHPRKAALLWELLHYWVASSSQK